MNRTFDLRIQGYATLVKPQALINSLRKSEAAAKTVAHGRNTIGKIMSGQDRRLLVVVGPCSIHDDKAALDYAERLNKLRRQVEETMLIVMRVYFEKPRTTIGWKGLINDPGMDGSCDVARGLKMARELLLQLAEMGLPAATEFLDPIIPQYIADLISWAAIGARTTESQTHRQMASGLSMPVGFKNGTEGNSCLAVSAIVAARAPQSFLGVDRYGRICIVRTAGNPLAHLVLRGGAKPNYDAASIQDTVEKLRSAGLPEIIMVDCSHGNSGKDHERQASVFRDVVGQRLSGSGNIFGLMLESFLEAGNQPFAVGTSALQYGVSITDECISWETTETLLLETQAKLLAQPSLAVA